jgi:hypothetical protein
VTAVQLVHKFSHLLLNHKIHYRFRQNSSSTAV